MRLIDAERLDKEGWMLRRVIRVVGDNPIIEQMFPSYFPTVEAEPVKREPCETCKDANLEQGDTLYYQTSWDGGIDFNYIHNIKYCPVCGRRLE